MTRFLVALIGLLIGTAPAPAQTPFYQGKTIRHPHRLPGRRPQRSLAAADRALLGKIHTRQPQLHCPVHAGCQLDDRGKPHRQRRQTGWLDARLDRADPLFRSAG